MTTQVRPVSGGAWNNASQSQQKISKKDTVYGVTLAPYQASTALRALNQWANCAGTGTAAAVAQEIARAIGLQLQEV
jgi:hypothetical protein